uniref:Uncharacterized protein n=1 Tax=Alexandrium andersonii TaxID=327968 RepID=A0A7S2J491_9DINO|mmetsp:Transcript_93570/g.209528  ORF Transcript_93570/g.209528 Transcript_93570/m.209528 type:complete len:190 (+) Transcript_93570:56-625(+)
MVPWQRGELLLIAIAIALQVSYRCFYDVFIEAGAGQYATEDGGQPPHQAVPEVRLMAQEKSPSAAKVVVEAVEVREFLASGCEGPPARLWHIRPSEPGACLSLRPKMSTPGAGRGAHSFGPEVLYGRVTCADLRRPEGGFVELCSSEGCQKEGCVRIPVMGEGECGGSFTGFAAASWRCVPEDSLDDPV